MLFFSRCWVFETVFLFNLFFLLLFALGDFSFITFVRCNSLTSDCIILSLDLIRGWRHIDFYLLTFFRCIFSCTFSGRITGKIRRGSLRGTGIYLLVGK